MKSYVYLVKNQSSNEISVCAWPEVLYPGTNVVAPTQYGSDLCVVIGCAEELITYVPGSSEICGACARCPEAQQEEIKENSVVWPVNEPDDSCCWDSMYRKPELAEVDDDILKIERIASPADMDMYQANCEREKEAGDFFVDRVQKRKLDMKLVRTHLLLDGQKILFFFTSEVRVDFRELVRDLGSAFHIRVELRQIGVRDEARILGGLAVCGRDFCCHAITDKLEPVSIKMAKEQNLSLNSMKISGPCGRLLCCLAYEYEFYLEEKQNYPIEGGKIIVGEEIMKVREVNILSKTVTVSSIEGGVMTIPYPEVFYNDEKRGWEVNPEFVKENLII